MCHLPLVWGRDGRMASPPLYSGHPHNLIKYAFFLAHPKVSNKKKEKCGQVHPNFGPHPILSRQVNIIVS